MLYERPLLSSLEDKELLETYKIGFHMNVNELIYYAEKLMKDRNLNRLFSSA